MKERVVGWLDMWVWGGGASVEPNKKNNNKKNREVVK